MNDKLLLELAAKAAGYKPCLYFEGYDWEHDENKGLLIHTEGDWGTSSEWWNPLTDDGDALRLAVRLLLEVNPTIPDKPSVSVYGNNRGRMVSAHEPRLPNIYAATRRAIVRAAAEIGGAK